MSSQSTLTDRPEAQPECVGCRDSYWKSFSHLFPQGFCPSTTADALQTHTQLRLQRLSGCLDTSNSKGIEKAWRMYTAWCVPYKCKAKSISGFEQSRSGRLLLNLQRLSTGGSTRVQGPVHFVKKASRREAGCYFHLIFSPEGMQSFFYCVRVVISPC